MHIAPTMIGHGPAGRRGDSIMILDCACAPSAIFAARRPAFGIEWLGLRSRDLAVANPLAAPAAANSGLVTVASKARWRAALQSRHSFAPGRLVCSQIRHFIACP